MALRIRSDWLQPVHQSSPAMLVAVPDFGREQLLATLVMFWILYFLIPFGTVFLDFGISHIFASTVASNAS